MIPTIYAKEMLEEVDFLDYIVTGEGEVTYGIFLLALEEKRSLHEVDGLAFKENGQVFVNKKRELIADLDMLPFPSRDIMVQYGMKYAVISSSRGCTHNCSFCISEYFWKVNDKCRWRGRSIKSVVNEIEYIMKHYGICNFDFIDNSIEDPHPNLERLRELAFEIIHRKLDIHYEAEIRAKFYKYMTDEFMEILIESGLIKIYVGIEAANTEDLRAYNKGASVEDNYNIVRYMKKWNINVEMGFINFNPYSTFTGLRKNIEYLNEFYDIAILAPLKFYMMTPCTRLYERIKKENLLIGGEYNDEIGYHFKDQRIERLANFLKDFLETFPKHYYDEIGNIKYQFDNITSILKRHLDQNDNILLEKMEEICQYNKNIMKKINNNEWFLRLLDIAEQNWSEEEAQKAMKQIMPVDEVRSYSKLMKSKIDAFFIDVIRTNRKYIKYLRWN